MDPLNRRRTDSNADDGATWLGGPPLIQGPRRSASKPRKPNVGRNRTIRDEVHPAATFGEATKTALPDLLQDELVRHILKWVVRILAVAVYMNYIIPVCIEPCPPALLPAKVNTATTTQFLPFSQQPTSIEPQAHPNIISAVKGYGNKAAGYRVKGVDHGAKYGAGIALAAIPGLWNNYWFGSNSGQQEHKYDPHRTRAWDLVIQRGRNMTTFTSLLSDLEGLSGTLYREFAEHMAKISPGTSPSLGLLVVTEQFKEQHSDINWKLDAYQELRKRAARALYIHRHPESDGQQLGASVKDLDTLRATFTEVGYDLFRNFHVAEKQIHGIIEAAESLPWHKEKDTWIGSLKYRSMRAAIGRLRQFDACIKTVRGMITSDLQALG